MISAHRGLSSPKSVRKLPPGTWPHSAPTVSVAQRGQGTAGMCRWVGGVGGGVSPAIPVGFDLFVAQWGSHPFAPENCGIFEEALTRPVFTVGDYILKMNLNLGKFVSSVPSHSACRVSAPQFLL